MKNKPLNVFIFGAGNMAVHLTKRFLEFPDKIHLAGAWNRTPGKWEKRFGKHIDIYDDISNIPQADIYIIAIKDDAVKDFSARLKHLEGLTVHTSGVLPAGILQTGRKGFFYPLQSFHKDRKISRWYDIPVFYNAPNRHDTELLERLASTISNNPVRISEEQKKVLHIAAVFANNFSNLMFSISDKILEKNGLKLEYLLPLLRETVRRLENSSPGDLQTGPARRKDLQTIRTHSEWLNTHDFVDEAKIYRILSDYLIKLYHK
jgi:predicted short-subunit dehydrogenase-like oxidoreductase (DUF2520 family)